MTRHQRRKLARARKDANGEKLNARALALLQTERLKANLMERKGNANVAVLEGWHKDNKGNLQYGRRVVATNKGNMGNRGIYQGLGLYPAPGYGTGAFKEKPLSERSLREQRALDKR